MEFTLERKQKEYIQKIHFEGFIKGHSIEGFVQIEGEPDSKARWRAERVLSTFKPIDK